LIKDTDRILIINFGGIGDILLSTPALRALKSSFPKTKIYFLVFPHVWELVNDLPYVDGIFIIRNNKRNIFTNMRTLLRLRREKFDVAINMRTLVSKRGAQKIKFLLNTIKPKLKVGRDTGGRGYFFNIGIPETDRGTKFEMEYDIDTVKALGVEVNDRAIDLKINEEAKHRINMLLESKGILKEDILIGIHPGGMPSHRWPIENFSKIIEQISKSISCTFVVTGGDDEVMLAEKLKNITGMEIINLAGKINLGELYALIKRCNLYVSNDTGTMHIAAILKTPLVAIFGPGYFTRFDPRNVSDKAVVLYEKVECAPCDKVKCDSMECLKVILPEEVTNAALHILKQNS
jgi:ADP-heptose:LPS heptosyltransferase